MRAPDYSRDGVDLYCGDCLEILPELAAGSVDCIVTDPPYPDYHRELYGHHDRILDGIEGIDCHQFVFWSARAPWPLDWTAIHIWDKRVGVGCQYERIFERHGGLQCRVFRKYFINSPLAAKWQHDDWTEHPSQKPTALLLSIIALTKGCICDPFMGSGTTGVACAQTGRRFIGIEIEPRYFEIAVKRIDAELRQGRLAFAEVGA